MTSGLLKTGRSGLLFITGFALPLITVALFGGTLATVGARILYTPGFDDPGPCCFYADAWNFELSQPVLYHDLGASIDNAKRADIIFIGNSRLQLGIREEFIVPLARRSGLKVFSIGAGHSESAAFALELIRRHDLRPGVFVVVGGPHVWEHRFSEVASESMAMRRWDAVKLRLETAASWFVRRHLHNLVPRVDVHGRGITSGYMIYRSETSGWWKPAIEPPWSYPTAWSEARPDYPRLREFARQMQSELDQRGGLLVSTIVPYGDTVDIHLPLLERDLGIAFINTRLTDLETGDGSHLNRESARRFTSAFWQEFISRPEVRRKLGLQ